MLPNAHCLHTLQEISRFLRHPRKPAILAMSRPDAKKNITTLVKAFGQNPMLRELSNLVLVMVSILPILSPACRELDFSFDMPRRPLCGCAVSGQTLRVQTDSESPSHGVSRLCLAVLCVWVPYFCANTIEMPYFHGKITSPKISA